MKLSRAKRARIPEEEDILPKGKKKKKRYEEDECSWDIDFDEWDDDDEVEYDIEDYEGYSWDRSKYN